MLYSFKSLFFQTIGFRSVGTKVPRTHFRRDALRVLQETFEKNSFINQSEAQFLAETLNVHPVKIKNWFHHQRTKGSLQTF